jgi:hypothetical protein
LKKNFIDIGWASMGDFGAVPADRGAFKAKVAHA